MREMISDYWIVALLANIVAASAVTIHAVLWKRETRAVVAWVGLAWLSPILGAIAYFLLGVNRIQRRATALKIRKRWRPHDALPLTPKEIDQREKIVDDHPNLVGLATLGDRLTGRPVLPGNQVEPLLNGDEAFPRMLRAIEEASQSVLLASYIFDSDRAGEKFLEALVAAGRRGVEVRVLIDAVGSKYSKPNMVRRLQRAGLKAAAFLPTRIPRLAQYANMRNHRKILVVDGKLGFTGGTNIREDHWLSLQPKFPVECLHFEIRGPVVAQLEEAFAIDWAFTTGELLAGEQWFPKLERAGTVWARGITHGPDEDFEKMTHTMIGALAVARRRARIVTPYFLPESPLIAALNVAAMRGVDVEILLPEVNNIRLVQWAMMAQLWQVLDKGCRVFFSPPPFDHTKLMVVDDVWTLIGSTNWDPRSLRLNFEFNVECYSESFAQKLNHVIDAKLAEARKATSDDLKERPFYVKLRDGFARLLSPYL